MSATATTEAQQVSPLAIANTFIRKYGVESGGLRHMKLQKLTYYCYAWWLSHYDTPCMTEGPQIWKFGPVFNSLYHAFKGHGAHPITTPQKETFFQRAAPTVEGELEELVDWVWQRYGMYSGEELSERTHAEGTPWKITAHKHNFRVPRHMAISPELIRDCFRAGSMEEVLERQ